MRFISLFGILAIISILYFFSTDRDKVNKKMIARALIVQIIFAFFIVKFPIGQWIIEKISNFVTMVINFGY